MASTYEKSIKSDMIILDLLHIEMRKCKALLGASMAVAVDRKVGCFCFGLGLGRALNATVAGINGPGKSVIFSIM